MSPLWSPRGLGGDDVAPTREPGVNPRRPEGQRQLLRPLASCAVLRLSGPDAEGDLTSPVNAAAFHAKRLPKAVARPSFGRSRPQTGEPGRVSPNRLEAFSDGVFAIAITLLVLDIHVPAPESTASLADALGEQWPSYVAYVVSFLTIGIIWINHHAMIRRLRAVDHGIMVWNLLVLLAVGVLPFTTALMAAYLREGQGSELAAAIYGGSFLFMSLIFAATNRHVLSKARLLREDVDAEQRRTIRARGVAGLVPYLVATALAPVSSYLTLGICAAVGAFYALPFASASESAGGRPAGRGSQS
jgi:TMEM175 potassium channel family protein